MAAADASPHPELTGEHHIQGLDRLHREQRPKAYCEIGTHHGEPSPSRAARPSRSIRTSVRIQTARSVTDTPFCAPYQQPNDQFLATIDPSVIFGRPIDPAFLDGMHRCEFLLRAFANTERFYKPNPVIALHDCVPVEFAMGARTAGRCAATGRIRRS